MWVCNDGKGEKPLGHQGKGACMTGKLVICPTPIGNLGDMPPRALDALREADVICAEDTRVTGRLLAALGISEKRIERLDENLMGRRADGIVERVRAGETIVYCTDAGMPGVSDPGLRLVRAAREAVPAVSVEVLPGPTAAMTAYVASGCVDPTFYFGGFFPRKAGERRVLLERLRTLDAALIFYESPNRLLDALAAIEAVLPARQMAVCRELSKLHEEVARGTAMQLRELFEERAVKGEIVIVIDGPAAAEQQADAQDALDRAAERANALAAQGMRPKDIARTLSAECGIARNDAYNLALDASKSNRSD